MRRLVISLQRAHDRRDWMVRQFAGMRLPFEFIDAVDMATVTPDMLRALTLPREDGHPWAPGETACFLSHRACWEMVAGGSDPFAAIFEDDVHFSADAASFLGGYDWIPADVGLLKIETFREIVRLTRPIKTVAGHEIARLKTRHWGSAAYILSKGVARRLLDASSAFDRTVDEFMFDPPGPGRDFDPWQLSPAICAQDMILKRTQHTLKSFIEPDRAQVRGPDAPLTPLGKALDWLASPAISAGEEAVKLFRYVAFGQRTQRIQFSP